MQLSWKATQKLVNEVESHPGSKDSATGYVAKKNESMGRMLRLALWITGEETKIIHWQMNE